MCEQGECIVSEQSPLVKNYPTLQQRYQSHDASDSDEESGNCCAADGEEIQITYGMLFMGNKPFVLYLLSYITALMGEWLTLVASIVCLKTISPDSQTALATLFILRLLPSVFASTLGGVIADIFDRRHGMIFLDISGAFVVMLYVPVVAYGKSLPMLYTVVFLQALIAALYEPIRQAILPMIVPEQDYLKKATTLTGIAWSTIAAIGSLSGGIIVSCMGPYVCFELDCLTYLISATLMWFVGGSWKVSDSQSKLLAEDLGSKSTMSKIKKVVVTCNQMTRDGAEYIWSSALLPLVLIKASGGILFGAADPLNVQFAHVEGDSSNDGKRLGMIYASLGLACLVGPLIADPFTDMKRPQTLMTASMLGLVFVTVGFAGWALIDSLFFVCFFTIVRGLGSSILWINSELLIQICSSKEMMGRVISVDCIGCTFSMACSTYLAGFLQDFASIEERGVSFVVAVMGLCVLAAWCCFNIQKSDFLMNNMSCQNLIT